MSTFKPISLSVAADIRPFVQHITFPDATLSFSNLFSWGVAMHYEYTVYGGYLLIRYNVDDKLHYLMPVGKGDIEPVIEFLLSDSIQTGHPFHMSGVSNEMRLRMEEAMPDRFRYAYNRNYFDYIYLHDDLATLQGKKLHAKRNHVNNFVKNYPDFEYIPLTADLIDECLELEAEWYAIRLPNSPDVEDMDFEKKMMRYALNHLKELEIIGGTLFVEGKLVAFTFGSPINNDTFDVSVEKADKSYEGVYAMINSQFMNHLPAKYLYINREEDMGIDGLRQAKLSYNPYKLLEKMDVYLNESVKNSIS